VNAVLSPMYAYRVLSRRSPIKKATALSHVELTSAELSRDLELMELSRELRPALEANDAFRRLLEPIRDVERVAGERSAALSEADAGYREQMARFDAELAQLRETEASAEAFYQGKAKLADSTKNELRRAEAKHQRVQIEIRGVLDVARQALGPAGGDMAPEHAAELAELQARAAALMPDVTRALATHATSTKAQDDAQAEVRRIQNQRRQLERQKASAGSALEKQRTVRAQSVSEAEKQRRDAMADVARAVLAARGAVAVPEPRLQALRDHDKNVEAAAIRLETYVRALDSYDRGRVKQGIILVLSVLGVVLLSILLKAML
jgi:chromosome segregation ATPase